MPRALPRRMTAPRMILAGASYLVTRRCSERRFFLKPSPVTNEIFLYVLAVACQRFGVHVHAFCVLSNHFHLVVTDPSACLPDFVRYLDSLVARATNASLGRFEGFWASATTYSAVAPVAPEDVIAKVAYTLANPVAAGLVRRAAEWPGLWTAPGQLGSGRLTVRRPKVFFRESGYMPDVAELVLTTPPGFAGPEEFREQVAVAFRDLERQIQRDFAAEQRGFLGVAKVLAQKPTARPVPGEPRFRLKPRLAAKDKWKRVEALATLKSFLRAYREAWNALRAGLIGVVFPAGTYHLRVVHGMQCAPVA